MILISSDKRKSTRKTLQCHCIFALNFVPYTMRIVFSPGFHVLLALKFPSFKGLHLRGRVKDPNKNLVAERAIRKLCLELLSLSQGGHPVVQVCTLISLSTADMKSRLQRDGFPACKLWNQLSPAEPHASVVSGKKLVGKKKSLHCCCLCWWLTCHAP